MDAGGLGESLREELRYAEPPFVLFTPEKPRERLNEAGFQLRKSEPEDYEYLVKTLLEEGGGCRIVSCIYRVWIRLAKDFQECYFHGPLYLSRTLGKLCWIVQREAFV